MEDDVLTDDGYDVLYVIEDVIVREAQYRQIVILHQSIAPGITLLLVPRCMDTAVHFDDKVRIVAVEVGDELAEGMLTPE